MLLVQVRLRQDYYLQLIIILYYQLYQLSIGGCTQKAKPVRGDYKLYLCCFYETWSMQSFHSVESCVHGYHVFQSQWNGTGGEVLQCGHNRSDPFAVAVQK